MNRFVLLLAGLFVLGLGDSGVAATTATADCATTIPDPLTFEALQSKIVGCSIRSVEDLLPLLPDDYQANYTLMFDSRSIQPSTKQAPRAILFGNTASAVITYNGAGATNGNELEVMQFRPESNQFEFRSISFSETAAATISAANPSLCMACHVGRDSNDPKPIWDGYLLWPGAYGEEDEATFIGYRTKENSADSADYQAFLKAGKLTTRYKLLKPYQHMTLQETPNTIFGDRLNILNARRLAGLIASDAKLRPYRYALLAATDCAISEPLSDFIPAKLYASAPHPLDWYATDTTQQQDADFEARLTRLKSLYAQAPLASRLIDIDKDIKAGKGADVADNVVPGSFRFIVEGLANDNLMGWAMEFGTLSYVFNSGSYDLDFVEFPLVEAAFKDDPDVTSLFQTSEWDKVDWADEDYRPASDFYAKPSASICAVLKQKSLAALGAL